MYIKETMSSKDILEDKAIGKEVFTESLVAFIGQMVEFLGLQENSVD